MKRFAATTLVSALLCGLTCLAVVPTAAGQSIEEIEDRLSNVNAYYYHAPPGAETIQVYALGTVHTPGVYEIPSGTNLGKLLALSGGPVQEVLADANTRKIVIRLTRPGNQSDEPVYRAELSNGEMPDPNSYPSLQEGDILQVEVVEDQKFTWRDGMSVINTAAVITLAVLRFSTGN